MSNYSVMNAPTPQSIYKSKIQGVGFTEDITVLNGEQASQNLKQIAVPELWTKLSALRMCNSVQVLNKNSFVSRKSVKISSPSSFYCLEVYLSTAWPLQTAWQIGSYSFVSRRQSLYSCFLQLGFSTSLSGKCYWLIKANCWQIPDSQRGQGERPGCGEGCDGWVGVPTRQVDAPLIIPTIDLQLQETWPFLWLESKLMKFPFFCAISCHMN